MSFSVEKKDSLVEGGRTSFNNCNKISWKLSIGIYGISVNKKIRAGKNAKKKLNAMEEALVVIAPFSIPSK